MDGDPEDDQSSLKMDEVQGSHDQSALAYLVLASTMVSRDVSTSNSDIDVTNVDDPQVAMADTLNQPLCSTSTMAAIPPQMRRHSDSMISIQRPHISISPRQSPVPSRYAQDSPTLSVSTSSTPPPILMSEFSHGEEGSSFMMTSDIDDHRKYEPISIDTVDHNDNATYTLPDSSPEMAAYDNGAKAQNRVYRCRLCSFSATTYTQLQLHMPRHGGMSPGIKNYLPLSIKFFLGRWTVHYQTSLSN